MALLAYIIQQIIAERPTLISGEQKTVGAYIQELILAPLGMHSTYFLLPDGAVPAVQTGIVSLSSNRVKEASASGAVSEQFPIHACYIADWMLMTSAGDISRLMKDLFVDTAGTFYAVGTSLLAGALAIKNSARPDIIKQAFGVQFFSADQVCSDYKASSASTLCPLSSKRDVWGVISAGTYSVVGGVCSKSPIVTGTTQTVSCVGSVHAHYASSAAKPASLAYVAATASLQQLYGDPSVLEGTTVTVDSQTKEGIFGFYVFLALVAVIFAVFLAGYLSEYFLHPAPVTGVLTVEPYPKLHYTAGD